MSDCEAASVGPSAEVEVASEVGVVVVGDADVES